LHPQNNSVKTKLYVYTFPSRSFKRSYSQTNKKKLDEKGVHPENYRLVAFKDMSNEDVFITKSTADTKETITVDGVEYPVVKWRSLELLTFYR
jgi:transcriptional accessory protein Tex/SPT6